MTIDTRTKEKFIIDYKSTYIPFRTLCEMYKISRPYGYTILKEYGIETNQRKKENSVSEIEWIEKKLESIEKKLDFVLKMLEEGVCKR